MAGIAGVGLLSTALQTSAVAASEPEIDGQASLTNETPPEVTPTSAPMVGRTATGTVGQWSGTGEISYQLRWQVCDYVENDDHVCETVESLTTTDPAATLAYTPTAADNLAERSVRYEVEATDATGSEIQSAGGGRVNSEHRFLEPREVDDFGQIFGTGIATIGADGATTMFFEERGANPELARGIYARRVSADGDRSLELVYPSPAEPGAEDQTGLVSFEAMAADDAGGVHVAFSDVAGRLVASSRDPVRGTWSEPEPLAATGTWLNDSTRAPMLDAAGNGAAAAAWVVPGNGYADPEDWKVSTHTSGGGWNASTHHFEQQRDVECTIYHRVSRPLLGIAPDGDVTLVWRRLHDVTACPDDDGFYELIEAGYSRGGAWSAVDEVARLRSRLELLLPKDLAVDEAGAALALTVEDLSETTTAEGELDLLVHTAPAGTTFGDLDPTTGSPADMVRHWDLRPSPYAVVDLAANASGQLAMAWYSMVPGANEYLAEVAHGSLAWGFDAPTVLAQEVDLDAPSVAIDADGHAAVAFEHDSNPYAAGGEGPVLALRPGGGPSEWGGLQSVDYHDGDVTRWRGDHGPTIAFDEVGALRLASDMRRPGLVDALGISKLAHDAGAPVMDDLADDILARPGVPLTLTAPATNDPDGLQLRYDWDLDEDGVFDDATGAEAEWTFPEQSDDYSFVEIAVRATSSDGDYAVSEGRVVVRPNQAPYLNDIGAPVNADTGEPVTYTALANDDADTREEMSYEWSFDGVVDASETGHQATHVFDSPGGHTVAVTVTDSEGASSDVDKTFTLPDEPQPDRLTVRASSRPTSPEDELGTGTISSDPEGIVDCRFSCGALFDDGATVTLTAAPDAGSELESWTGCDNAVGTRCVVTLNGNTDIEAEFIADDGIAEHVLTVAKTGNGRGAIVSNPAGVDCGVDCGQDYEEGTTVMLTADPVADSELAGWTGCDSTAGSTCTVTMSAAKTVTAEFTTEQAPVEHTLTVAKSGQGSGTVNGEGIACGTDCDQTYPEGTEIVLDAVADDDSTFASWSGCDAIETGDCVITVDADTTVTAAFDRARSTDRTLTVTKQGDGTGSVTGTGIDCGADCSETFGQGSEIVLSAVAFRGSDFAGWENCTEILDTGGCRVVLDDNVEVGATFDAESTTSVAPKTKITKVKVRGRKVTVKFRGSRGASPYSFECKLDRGRYRDCASPLRAKLKPGKHKLKVIATGADGTADPSPAKVKFRIKKRRR